MKYLTIIAAVWIAGCASSLQGIRKEPPSQIIEVDGYYEYIGSCIAAGLQSSDNSMGEFNYEVIDNKKGKRMTITGKFSYRSIVMIDVTVIDRSGKSSIEVRGQPWPNGKTIESYAIGVIESCSK